MNKKYIIIVSMLLVLVSPALAQNNNIDVKKTYTIGVLLPLSGEYEKVGQRAKQGIEFALISLSKLYNNINLKLIFKDTQSKDNLIEKNIDDIIAKDGKLIVGPIINPEKAAIYSQEKKIPIITLTNKPYIENIGDFVFKNFLSHKEQITALIDYATNVLNIKNFAILYPEDDHSKKYADLFCWELKRRGDKIVKEITYKGDKTDFSKEIKTLYEKALKKNYIKEEEDNDIEEEEIVQELDTKENWEVTQLYNKIVEEEEGKKETKRRGIKEEEDINLIDFDAIFIPDTPYKVKLISSQLIYYGLEDVYILGTNLLNSDYMKQIAENSNDKIVFTDCFFEDKDEKSRQFSQDFSNLYSLKPTFIEALSFDTIGIIYSVLNQNSDKILSKDEVAKELLKIKNYEGITGNITFSEYGSTIKKPLLITINKNKFKLIK